MSGCNTDEIVKQLKELDMLKDLRDKLGDTTFIEQFPELNSIGGRLDDLITQTQTEIDEKMGECGALSVDELPGSDEIEVI